MAAPQKAAYEFEGSRDEFRVEIAEVSGLEAPGWTLDLRGSPTASKEAPYGFQLTAGGIPT
jgi:hypothetical protein